VRYIILLLALAVLAGCCSMEAKLTDELGEELIECVVCYDTLFDESERLYQENQILKEQLDMCRLKEL